MVRRLKNRSPRGARNQKNKNNGADIEPKVKAFLKKVHKKKAAMKNLKRESIHGILNCSSNFKDSPNSNGMYKRRNRRSAMRGNRFNRRYFDTESTNNEDCIILPDQPPEVISLLDSDSESENNPKKRKSSPREDSQEQQLKRKRIIYSPKASSFARYPQTEAFTPFFVDTPEEKDDGPSFFIDTKKEEAPILQIPLYQPKNDSIICLDDTLPDKSSQENAKEKIVEPIPSTSSTLPKYESVLNNDSIIVLEDDSLVEDGKKNRTLEEGEILDESFIPLSAPSTSKEKPRPKISKRLVILDGNNIAMAHGNNKSFSVQGIEIAIKHFEDMGHEVKAIIPQFRMKLHKSTSQVLLEKLQDAKKILLTPCKNLPGKVSASYDDRFIIEVAEKCDAAIISNDNYKDLMNEKPEWHKIITSRVVGFMFCGDAFFVPNDPYGKHGPKLQTILNKYKK